uniref:Uncharacterized protein n=1 Tax=Siphoviridae sp. ctazQ13 TaxID=2823587 RepID=A0A8S5LB52_9CAUD|nr:MAG TPA: hypothetical protein [Siphoviridae sp. ctazQ13]
MLKTVLFIKEELTSNLTSSLTPFTLIYISFFLHLSVIMFTFA